MPGAVCQAHACLVALFKHILCNAPAAAAAAAAVAGLLHLQAAAAGGVEQRRGCSPSTQAPCAAGGSERAAAAAAADPCPAPHLALASRPAHLHACGHRTQAARAAQQVKHRESPARQPSVKATAGGLAAILRCSGPTWSCQGCQAACARLLRSVAKGWASPPALAHSNSAYRGLWEARSVGFMPPQPNGMRWQPLFDC